MRIDEDIIGGHIYVSEWLLQSRSRNHWRTVIDGIDLWFSDREIITRTVFDPNRVELGGSFYIHGLGSHTTLAKAAVGTWSDQKTMLTLNDPRPELDASATVNIHGRCLMTQVKELHVKATPDELVIYIPAAKLVQAFEFKPRAEAQ